MRVRLIAPLSLLAFLVAATPLAAASSIQFQRRPDVNGDQIVFTSEGDLWLGSISGGSAMRITSDDGYEGPARFSPDGRRIAFTAQYDGNVDVYVMDATGGEPRRLTWDPLGVTVTGWSADGREVLFRSRRAQPTRRNRLWAVPADGGSARLLPIPYVEFAAANADGRRIAYVPVSAEWQHWKHYQGGQADDIWLADTVAHAFRRLTDDPGVDTEPVWVGDALYFVSERDGHSNLWRLDPASGAVRQATHYTDYDVRYPESDGQRVVFEHGDGLALYDPASDRVQELRFTMHSDRIHAREKRVSALKHLFSVEIGPTAKRLLVSARGQILSAPADKGDVRVIAAQAGARCQYPAWSPDGKQVAFVSDRSGEEQVWLAPADGSGATRQLTRDHRGPLGKLAWSPDGKWIATSDREMRVLLVNVASGKLETLDQSDRGGSYDLTNFSARFTPDSRWFAFTHLEPNWNWTVWLYDIEAGLKFRVSSPEMTSAAPAFDADGKYLYFLSDRSFDPVFINANRFFTFDKLTKVSVVTLATDGKSPFLIVSDEEGGAAAADKAKATDKQSPTAKTGATKPPAPPAKTRVDVTGIAGRVIDVPVPADRYLKVEPVEGRLLLETSESATDAGASSTSRQLRAFDMKKQEVVIVAKKISDFDVSADRKKVLVQVGKSWTVMDVDAKELPEDKGKVETSAWMLTVNPAEEWKQIFHETWRLARDFFYDPGMHGADWSAVGKRYEAMLPAVADRSDLAFVQGEMVAELNCGHAYIRGGDQPEPPSVPMGYLGADVAPVAGATPAYRVEKLYSGDGFDYEARSPLVTPGVDVRVGDYILAIGGRPVSAGQDLQALLVGTADQTVRLSVNSRPTTSGARDVWIKPLASERQARYYDWVESRRAYVRAHGGEGLGYLHIPSMSATGLQEFGKHYYPNLAKNGMIFDVRYNGGGYIDAMLLLQIAGKPYSYFKPRYGASWTRQDWSFAGHSVALCNQNSGSDAEEFSDAFQRLKLGPVIGVPTWGAEVGSGDGYALLDGGAVYIPNYGEWVPEGKWVIEGAGVQPDIVVEDDPALIMAGRDPQLDRAIEYLKDQLKRDPIVRPSPPPFPVKTPAK